MKKLHPAQEKILQFIKEGKHLSMIELMELTDSSSSSVVHHHIKQLIKHNYITPKAHKNRLFFPEDYIINSPKAANGGYFDLYIISKENKVGSCVEKLFLPYKLIPYKPTEVILIKEKKGNINVFRVGKSNKVVMNIFVSVFLPQPATPATASR